MSVNVRPSRRYFVPSELWVLIFKHVQESLYNVALVSKSFYTLATPIFYRTISLTGLGKIFRLLDTLVYRSQRPRVGRENGTGAEGRRLGEYIVSLRLIFQSRWMSNGDYGGRLFEKSLRMVERMLEGEQMKNLKYLNLDLEYTARSAVLVLPRQVFFKLESFSTEMYCTEPVALFLHSQPSLKSLTLEGGYNFGFMDYIQKNSRSTAKPFIPNLTAIDVRPVLAPPILSNRPIKSVHFPIFEPEFFVLSSLKESRAPGGVTQLTLYLPRTTDPAGLLYLIAEAAPRVVELRIYFGSEFGSGFSLDEVNISSLFYLLAEHGHACRPPC